MSAYPLVIDGTRIRALVVGGGAVAHRKAAALVEAGATLRVVAPTIAAPMRDLAAAAPARVSVIERPYAAADIDDATLVVAATDSRDVNARVARDARAAARLVNVADEPADGDWTTAAVHRAEPLVIAVTAGVPAASARVRDALAGRFDSRYARSLGALAALRRRLLDAAGPAAWRDAEQALVGADFCDVIEHGQFASRLAAWQ